MSSRTSGVEGLETFRLRPEMSVAVHGLLRIYAEAIPASERKDDRTVREMLARSDYEFRIARRGQDVVGFTIVKIFRDCADASLLEYMAVGRQERGSGIGGLLFREACSSESTASRYVLVEVEDEAEVVEPKEDSQRGRRKAFYRKNGCREVTELSYLMPTVSARRPPRMNLLAYRQNLPSAIDSTELRRWLQCIYEEVYRQSTRDPRIEQMLAALPKRIVLQ